VTNIKLGTPDMVDKYAGGDVTCTFKVEKLLLGDVNGDGKVNVVDIALVRDHILGNAVETFIEKAADLNKDDRINVTDLALIRDIILSN
jgi:hypothetical protein